MNTTETQAKEIIDSIEYQAEFVPFSQSRNKDNKDKSLNWVVSLTRNGVTLKTDYSYGVGLIPGYNHKAARTVDGAKALDNVIEKGHRLTDKGYSSFPETGKPPRTKQHLAPKLEDVLYCLLMDADVLNHDSFEDWAPEFGLDPDSRSAEKVYQACLANALKVNRMFSEQEREILEEYFQDW